jgi:hypothetical protein
MSFCKLIFAESNVSSRSEHSDSVEINQMEVDNYDDQRAVLRRKVHRMFINAAASTGKTSLAFHLAYEEASFGGVPLFICSKSKIQQRFPLKVDVQQPTNSDLSSSLSVSSFSPTVLSRIHMKYVESLKDLFQLLAGVQSFQPQPTMIVVDELSDWLSGSNDERNVSNPLQSHPHRRLYDHHYLDSFLFVVSFIEDSCRFLSQNKKISTFSSCSTSVSFLPKNDSSPLKVVMTVNSGDDKSMINIMKRYGDVILSMIRLDGKVVIKKYFNFHDDPGILLLSSPSTSVTSNTTAVRINEVDVGTATLCEEGTSNSFILLENQLSR